MVLPFIEDRADLIELYKDDRASFWLRLLFPLEGDTLFQDCMFLIIDGAHRRYVSRILALLRMWSRFLPPTMSYGALVSCVCVCCVNLVCPLLNPFPPTSTTS